MAWLDADINVWYKKHHKENPNQPLTRIYSVNAKLLGTADDRKLASKGAQTWGLLLYVLDLNQRLGDMWPQELLSRLFVAAERLKQLMVTLRADGVNLSHPRQEDAFACITSYCDLVNEVDELRTQPKNTPLFIW